MNRRDSLDALELLILAALTPILLFPRGPWPWLALLLLPVWLAQPWAGRPIVPATPLNPAIGLLAAVGIISTVGSIDPESASPKLAALMLGIAAYFALVRVGRSPPRFVWLLRLHLAAGVGLAGVVIFGTAWIDKWPVVSRLTAGLPVLIRGLPGAEEGFQPNAAAGSLLLFAPVALWVARERALDRLTRGAAAVTAAVTGATIVLTQSRGALVAAVLGAVLLFIFRRRSRVGLAVLFAVLFAGAGMTLVVLESPAALARALPRAAGPNLVFNVASRLELWRRSLDFVADHPWRGVGFNGLRHQIQVEQPLFLIEAHVDPVHAHNHLIQAAADLGVPGLVAYLAIWVGTTTMLIRTSRAGAAGSLVAEGVLLSLWCHFVFSMTDAIPLGAKVGVTFWLTLAVANAASVAKLREQAAA